MSSSGPRAGSRAASVNDNELDYYQMLGAPYTATSAEITRAYRAAMKRAHPDRQDPVRRAEAEEQAKLLNRAFTTLSNPTSRRAYDTTIRASVVQDQIMGRYVGGFSMMDAAADASGQTADPFGDRLRRELSRQERRERIESDRKAILHVVVIFGGVTLAVVAGLLLWAALSALVEALI